MTSLPVLAQSIPLAKVIEPAFEMAKDTLYAILADILHVVVWPFIHGGALAIAKHVAVDAEGE